MEHQVSLLPLVGLFLAVFHTLCGDYFFTEIIFFSGMISISMQFQAQVASQKHMGDQEANYRLKTKRRKKTSQLK